MGLGTLDEIHRLREENARLKAKLARVVEAAEAYVEPHSAACCTPTPGDGTFPPGPLTPNWCKCRDRTRALRVALAAAKGE